MIEAFPASIEHPLTQESVELRTAFIMLIMIDPHSAVPVYRQVMDQIKFQIAVGRIQEGDELPSTRSLSTELKVNPMTISKAYSLLESEKVIQRRPGLPSVVAPRSEDDQEASQIELLRQALEPVVNLVDQLGWKHDDALGVMRAMLADLSKRGRKP